MGKVRDIRLQEDRKKLERLAESCPYLSIQSIKGNPPAEYVLVYNLRGYIDGDGNTRNSHQVRLTMPSDYPISSPPSFKFLDSIWHPNVWRNGDVCMGLSYSVWKPGFRIDDLVKELAKYICFTKDSYNLNSKANDDCNAEWIRSHTTPIDNTNVLREDKPVIVVKKPKIDIKVKNTAIPISSPLQEKIKIRV